MVAGALGCRIDGGQAEFVRVPYADQGLNKIPDTVTDEQALFTGDVLAPAFGPHGSPGSQKRILSLSLAQGLQASALCCA